MTKHDPNERKNKRVLVKASVMNNWITIDPDHCEFIRIGSEDISWISRKNDNHSDRIEENNNTVEKLVCECWVPSLTTNHLPHETWSLSALKHLDAVSIGLDTLPPSIGQLRNLEFLNLALNSIVYLPDEIGNLSKLKYLFLSRNPILALPASIGKLKKLHCLYLDDTGVRRFPNSFWDLNRLESLSIRGIYSVDDVRGIKKLQNLRYLSMSQIKSAPLSVPEEVGYLTNLEVLRLDGFNLHFPQSLGNLKQLKRLDVSKVHYSLGIYGESGLQMFIRGLPNLETLYMVSYWKKSSLQRKSIFLLDLIRNTPSLVTIDCALEEYSSDLAYALACNRFRRRFPNKSILADEKLPWPKLLSRPTLAFDLYPRRKKKTTTAKLESHDAIYTLLSYGRDSFVQALLAREIHRD